MARAKRTGETDAIIYCRVSTRHQTTDLQREALVKLAEQRGFNVVKICEDVTSGRKASRPALDEAMSLLRKGQASVLLAWKLDRIGRSLTHLIALVEELRTLNVRVVFAGHDLDTGTPAGRALFALSAVFAEFEADLIQERVRAGLERAKAAGTKLGRPSKMDPDEAVRLVAEWKGVRPAARAANVSASTILRAMERADLTSTRQAS